jgi:hypothetical protein
VKSAFKRIIRVMHDVMAKGQARSNKEVKKPKAEKPKAGAVAANPAGPKTNVKFGKKGLETDKR